MGQGNPFRCKGHTYPQLPCSLVPREQQIQGVAFEVGGAEEERNPQLNPEGLYSVMEEVPCLGARDRGLEKGLKVGYALCIVRWGVATPNLDRAAGQ